MNSTSKKISAIALAVAPIIAISTSSLKAVPIAYSTGFEAPFVNGSAVPAVGTNNGWHREDGAGPTSLPNVNITNTFFSPGGGTQSLRVQNQGPNTDQSDVGSVTYVISPVAGLVGANNLVANGTPFVHIQWDMMVQDGADINQTSDLWGFDVYDSTSNVRTLSVARSALDNAAPNPQPDTSAIYTTGPAGFSNPIDPTAIATGPGSGVWNTYALDLNYTTHTFTFSMGAVGGPLTAAGGVRAMNAFANDGIDLNFKVDGRGLDSAYFDNFSINAVPEPSSIAVLGLGSVALLRRRRRSN